MGSTTLYVALIALLAFALAIALVYELVAPVQQEKTRGVTGGGTGTQDTRGLSPSGPAGKPAASGAGGNSTAAPKELEHGELDWQRKTSKKQEEKPAKAESSYDRERDVVKPDMPEGDAAR